MRLRFMHERQRADRQARQGTAAVPVPRRRAPRVLVAFVAALATLVCSVSLTAPASADQTPAAGVRAIGASADSGDDYPALVADTISLTKVSDGTHDGTTADECYLNSANGFPGGDDSATDGIVCSGDTVKYHLALHLEAGRKRTLTLRFDLSKAAGLDLTDLKNQLASFCNRTVGGIAGTWNASAAACVISVPRGVKLSDESQFATDLSVTAADSGGVPNTGNVLSATLATDQKLDADGNPSVISSAKPTDPVTVISRPIADLTIDAGDNANGAKETYTQADKGAGQIIISPYSPSFEGWNNTYGIAAPGPWTTDVDVTQFVALPGSGCGKDNATSFSFDDGTGSRTVTPVRTSLNGTDHWVIKGLTGSKNATLHYQLPTCALPTGAKSATRQYEIGLIPQSGSFATSKGGTNMLTTDPGSDKGSTESTENLTINKHTLNTRRGYVLPNNNWGVARITFDENAESSKDATAGVTYYVWGPRDFNKTLFDTPVSANGSNIQWDSSSAYQKQGLVLENQHDDYDHVVHGNQMRGEIDINTSDGIVADVPDTSVVKAGITLNYTRDTFSRTMGFDPSQKVVVSFASGKGDPSKAVVLDPSTYTVQWRTYATTSDGTVASSSQGNKLNLADDDPAGGSWTTSQTAPNTTVNQVCVSFKKDAFPFGASKGGHLYIDAPLLVPQTYTNADDQDKILISAGTVTASKSSAQSKLCGTDGCAVGKRLNTVPIAVPRPTVLDTTITNTSSYELLEGRPGSRYGTGVYSTSWHVDNALGASSARGPFSPSVSLKLDKWFNASTFKLTGSQWKVDSTTTNSDGTTTVVVSPTGTGVGLTLRDTAYTSFLGTGIDFTVRTKTGMDVSAQSITADTTMASPIDTHATISSRQPSTATAHFVLDNAGIVYISADNDGKAEEGDDLSWTAVMQPGKLPKGAYWYDRVFLPRSAGSSTAAPDQKESTWLGYVAENAGWTAQCDAATGQEKSGVYDQVCRSAYHGGYTLEKIRLLDYASGAPITVWYPSASDAAKVSLPDEQKQCTDPSSPENMFGCDVTYHKAVIASDGTLSFPDLPAGQAPLALYVRGDNADGTHERMGVRLRISITPNGEKTDDAYVAWIGMLRTSENKDQWKDINSSLTPYAKDQLSTPWPAANRIVTASVTGTIWRDDDKNGSIGSSEEGRYTGVTVTLLRCAADGTACTTAATTTSDSNGTYDFTGLKHGTYKVSLGKVRTDAQGKVTTGDGTLKADGTDRFGVTRSTTQTYSYNGRHGTDAKTSAMASLSAGQQLEHVDFGFYRPVADASLDKSPSVTSVDADGTTGTAKWDITVRNTGNLPLTSASLTDRLSDSAYDVSASMDHTSRAELDQASVASDLAGSAAPLFTDKDGYLYGVACTGTGTGCSLKEYGRGGSTAPYPFFAGMASRPVFSPTYLSGTTDTKTAGGAYFADAQGVLYRFDPRNTASPVTQVEFGASDQDASFKPGLVQTDPIGGNGIVLMADRQGRLHSLSTTSRSARELGVFGGDAETHGDSWDPHPHFADTTTLALWGTLPARVALTSNTGKLSVVDVAADGSFSTFYTLLAGFTDPATVTFPAGMAAQIDDQEARRQLKCIPDPTGGCVNVTGMGAAGLTATDGTFYLLTDYSGGTANIWLLNPSVYTSDDNDAFASPAPITMPVMHRILPFLLPGTKDPLNMNLQHLFYTDSQGQLWALTRHYHDASVAGVDRSRITAGQGVSQPRFASGLAWIGTSLSDPDTASTAVTDERGHLWSVTVNNNWNASGLKHSFSAFRFGQEQNLRSLESVDPASVTLKANTPMADQNGRPVFSAIVSDAAGTPYQIQLADTRAQISYNIWTNPDNYNLYIGDGAWHTSVLSHSNGYALIAADSVLSATGAGTNPTIGTLAPGSFIPVGSGTMFTDGAGTVWFAQGTDPAADASVHVDHSLAGPWTLPSGVRTYMLGKDNLYHGVGPTYSVSAHALANLTAVPGLKGQLPDDITVASTGAYASPKNSTLTGTQTQWCLAGYSGAQSDGSVLCEAGRVRIDPLTRSQDGTVSPAAYGSVSNKDEAGTTRRWINRRYAGLPTIQPGGRLTLHLSARVRLDATAATPGGQIIGNQAWFTSEQTPRSGLHATGSSATTPSGTGLDAGDPYAPYLPSSLTSALYAAAGIKSVNPDSAGSAVRGCSANTGSGTQANDQNDDLCDQVPAVFVAPTTPTKPATGKVSGFVWFDNMRLVSGGRTTVTPSNALYRKDSTDNASSAHPDEPAANVLVTISDADDPSVPVGSALTDASGKWSLGGLTSGHDYVAHYDTVGVTRANSTDPTVAGEDEKGVIWRPVTTNVETKTGSSLHYDLPDDSAPTAVSTLYDSDVDQTGYVVDRNSGYVKRLTASADGTAGRADLGLAASDKASVSVLKGSHKWISGKSDGDMDVISGTRAVQKDSPSGVSGLPLSALPDCVSPNAPWRRNAGHLDDGDADPRTQAYALCLTNNGNSTLTDVTLEDKTIHGSDAAISGTFRHRIRTSDGGYQLDPSTYTLGTDKRFYARTASGSADTTKPLTMAPGDVLEGAVDVPFRTEDYEASDKGTNAYVHEDLVTVTASSDGTTVTDKDYLQAEYHVVDYSLKIAKTSSEDSSQKVKGATFTVTRCEGFSGELPQGSSDTTPVCPATPVSGAQGTFAKGPVTVTTGSDGQAVIKSMDMGVYQIREVTAPDGFYRPQGTWYVRIDMRYRAGDRIPTKVMESGRDTTSLLPAAAQVESNDVVTSGSAWGTVTIADQPYVTSLPQAGGRWQGWIAAGLSLLLVIGLAAAGVTVMLGRRGRSARQA